MSAEMQAQDAETSSPVTCTETIQNDITANTNNDDQDNFNIEVAMNVIPIFSGNYKKLPAFLKIIEIIDRNLTASGKKTLIDFVFTVKLSETVQAAIGTFTVPETFADLKKSMEQRYKSNFSSHEISQMLSDTRQERSSINSYGDKIMVLLRDWNMQLNREDGREITADLKDFNHDRALHAFEKGLDSQYKLVIAMRDPKTLPEAIEMALEVESNYRIVARRDSNKSEQSQECSSSNEKSNENKYNKRNVSRRNLIISNQTQANRSQNMINGPKYQNKSYKNDNGSSYDNNILHSSNSNGQQNNKNNNN